MVTTNHHVTGLVGTSSPDVPFIFPWIHNPFPGFPVEFQWLEPVTMDYYMNNIYVCVINQYQYYYWYMIIIDIWLFLYQYTYVYIYYHISIIIIETIIIDGLFYPHLISFHGHQWLSDLRCHELLQQNSMGLNAAKRTASFAEDDGIVHPRKKT